MASGLGLATLAFLFGGYPLLPGETHRIREAGLDRLAPIHDDRRIETTSAHLYAWEKRHASGRFDVRLGVTTTRATGSITQLVGSLEGGDLRSVTFDSPAWGIGPGAEARFALWRGDSARLLVAVSGAVIVYDRRFPAGGDRYNGMLQAGPTLTLPLGNEHLLGIGYRWMHVSNGQGLGAHNPSYEARGVSIRYSRAL